MNKNLYMEKIGKQSKIASFYLNKSSIKKRNNILKRFVKYLRKNKSKILRANRKDLFQAKKIGIKKNMIDRLELNNKKIFQIINSIQEIIKFKDPIGKNLSFWKRPNGLIIKKVSIPLGVIGVIYESRPNVTSDVASLCLKSGNAVILRGGSEALNSNKILIKLFKKALIANRFDKNCVQLIEKKK